MKERAQPTLAQEQEHDDGGGAAAHEKEHDGRITTGSHDGVGKLERPIDGALAMSHDELAKRPRDGPNLDGAKGAQSERRSA